MLFSSVPFLYYFLPCVTAVYFAVPKTLKNMVLLLSSLLFYGFGEPRFLFFMLASICQGFLFGLMLDKSWKSARTRKILMVTSLLISLGLLCYCKYVDFFIENFNALTGISVPTLNIALPIGISFYTFQNMSYIVDVYRKRVKPQKNFINLALYIAMFPQLIAGPIVRYQDIEGQLSDRIHSVEKATQGIRRFTIGLAKKILIANVLGELVEIFKSSPDERTVAFVWLYAIAYTLHIYFDFSGYSDMAIGLGYIFGFKLPENFNYPYISKSITEFWRRWHISLGQWFRDYLYIPLGGNRVSRKRWLINILVVWLATGFWHGAAWNFIVWGLMYAMLLAAEKPFHKLNKKIQPEKSIKYSKKTTGTKIISTLKSAGTHIYTMLFVTIGFVLFDAQNISEGLNNISSLFGTRGLPLTSEYTAYVFESYITVILMAVLGATPLVKNAYDYIGCANKTKIIVAFLEPVGIVLLWILCTAYLVDGSFNPFLYFRF